MIINTVFSTITCEAEGCPKTVTFTAAKEQEELSKPENAWVLKTARIVRNLVPAPGQQKPKEYVYCSDECEVKTTATGAHNVPEPKRIIDGVASAAQVAEAASAAKMAELSTEALKSGRGGPVLVK
jgi:hypothetical protein